MLSLGSLTVVVAFITATNETVRGRLIGLFDGSHPIAIATPNLRVQHVASVVADVVGLPGGMQLPLVGLALAAFVLVVLMART